jgi:hypothetical protein
VPGGYGHDLFGVAETVIDEEMRHGCLYGVGVPVMMAMAMAAMSSHSHQNFQSPLIV